MANSRTYKIWTLMKRRCLNEKDPAFHHYGGMGIEVCERWADYSTFLKDMGDPPTDKHSLDRIDGSKGYSPENCRWATQSVQTRNRRKFKNSSSRYKGVCFQKASGKWIASTPSLRQGDRQQYISVHATEKAAAIEVAVFLLEHGPFEGWNINDYPDISERDDGFSLEG